MISVAEAEQLVFNYWQYLNSDDSGKMSGTPFAPNYTYQGQPGSSDGTAHGMGGLFDLFSYYHLFILDLFGEQKGDQIKVVIRWMLHASLKADGSKHQAMATNIMTIGSAGLISNWQSGFRGLQDATPVDYFIVPEGVLN